MKGGEERWPISVFKYGIDDASGANADERRRPSFEESRTAATSREGEAEGEGEERRSEKRHEISRLVVERSVWRGTNSALSKSITGRNR